MREIFAEMAAEYQEEIVEKDEEPDEEYFEPGDECPEGHCNRTLHKLSHGRNSQLGTEAHSDAPETEIVCRADGVIESF